MRSRRARSLIVLGWASRLVTFVTPLPVLAAEPAGPVAANIRIDGPTSCLTEAGFWAALARRTDRLRPARAGEDASTIEVSARMGAQQSATGELRILRDGLRSDMRRFDAASCDELLQAISLVAALAFDPSARLEPPAAARPALPTPTRPATPAAAPAAFADAVPPPA